jgi:hypothetical protein
MILKKLAVAPNFFGKSENTSSGKVSKLAIVTLTAIAIALGGCKKSSDGNGSSIDNPTPPDGGNNQNTEIKVINNDNVPEVTPEGTYFADITINGNPASGSDIQIGGDDAEAFTINEEGELITTKALDGKTHGDADKKNDPISLTLSKDGDTFNYHRYLENVPSTYDTTYQTVTPFYAQDSSMETFRNRKRYEIEDGNTANDPELISEELLAVFTQKILHEIDGEFYEATELETLEQIKNDIDTENNLNGFGSLAEITQTLSQQITDQTMPSGILWSNLINPLPEANTGDLVRESDGLVILTQDQRHRTTLYIARIMQATKRTLGLSVNFFDGQLPEAFGYKVNKRFWELRRDHPEEDYREQLITALTEELTTTLPKVEVTTQ